MNARRRHELSGCIVSAGFASGHRVVIGSWRSSPIGPLTDLMWAGPDGHRTLFVPTPAAGRFVSAVYEFDEVQVVPMSVERSTDELTVHAGGRRITANAGRGVSLPVRRPPWFTQRVEGPIARALLGVHTYGVSPTGVEEWYRATRARLLVAASATIEGTDLGALVPLTETGFGFSEPPRHPSWVDVHPILRFPTPVHFSRV